MNGKHKKTLGSFAVVMLVITCSFCFQPKVADASILSSIQDFFSNLFGKKETTVIQVPVKERTTQDVPVQNIPPAQTTSELPPVKGGSDTAVSQPITNTSTTKIVTVQAPAQVIKEISTQYISSGVTQEALNNQLRGLKNDLQQQIANNSSNNNSTNGGYTVPPNLFIAPPDLSVLKPTTLSVSGSSSFMDAFFNGAITLASTTPTNTTSKLYNNAGSLYWNGSVIAGASVGNWTTNGTDVYRATGNVGIGNTNATERLTVTGNILASGTINAGAITGTSFIGNGSQLTNITATNISNFGSPFYTFFHATTTDALAEGSTNKYYTDARVGNYLTGSSTLASSLNYWAKNGTSVYYNGGNVGIGTSNPSDKLHMVGTDNQGLILENTTNDLGAGSAINFYQNTAGENSAVAQIKSYLSNGAAGSSRRGALEFFTKSGGVLSPSMTVRSEGVGIGIGIINPSAQLEVSNNTGVVKLLPSGTNSGGIYGANSGGNLHIDTQNVMYLNYYSGNGVYFGNGASGIVGTVSNTGNLGMNGNLTISGTGNSSFAGNVGIGTTNPTNLLTIKTVKYNDAKSFLLHTDDGTGFGSGTASLRINPAASSGLGEIATLNNDGLRIGASNSSGSTLYGQIQMNSSGIGITGGNVGIGTANPNGKLHVFNGSSGATVNAIADDIIVEGLGDAGISILGPATNERFIAFGSPSSGTDGLIRYSPSTHTMQFQTSDGSILRLANTQLVGGNGTPNNPAYSFINGTTAGMFLDAGSGTDVGISTNGSEKFRVTGGGNVGIGTTSPSAKLSVAGTSLFTELSKFTGGISSPGNYASSEQFGVGASTGAQLSLAVGSNASATVPDPSFLFGVVAIGPNASANGADATAIGYASNASANGATAVGSNTIAGSYGTALGISANANYQASVALGAGAQATAANQFVVGSNGLGGGAGYKITDAYFGPVIDTSPSNFSINTSGGSGTNIAGANLTVAAGKATGNAAGGALIFSTSDVGSSGTTLQSLTEKMRITANGNVGIGTNNPISLLANGNNTTFLNLYSSAGGIGVANKGINWAANEVGFVQGLYQQSTDGNANGLLVKIAGTNASNKILTLNSNGTDQFTVTGAGNVGIGTTNPGAALEVSRPVAYPTTIANFNLGGYEIFKASAISGVGSVWESNNAFGSLNIRNDTVNLQDNSGTTYLRTRLAGGTTAGVAIGGGGFNPNSTLSVSGNASVGSGYIGTAAPTNGMIVEGNVGIGTTSPSAKLTVNGPTYLTGPVGIGGTGTAQALDVVGLNSSYGIITRTVNGGDYLNLVGGNSSFGFIGYDNPAGTNGISLLQSGNIGIGTTSPYAKLSVAGGIVADSINAVSTTATSTFSGGALLARNSGYVGIGTNLTGAPPSSAYALTVDAPSTGSDYSGGILLRTKGFPTSYNFSINPTLFGGGDVRWSMAMRNNDTDYNVMLFKAGNISTPGRIVLGFGGYPNTVNSVLNVNGNAAIGSGYYTTAAPTDGMLVQGSVGVGTTSPSAKLSVTSSGTGTGRAFALSDSANAEKFTVLDNGNVGIGTTSPYAALSIDTGASKVGLVLRTLTAGYSPDLQQWQSSGGSVRASVNYQGDFTMGSLAVGSGYVGLGGSSYMNATGNNIGTFYNNGFGHVFTGGGGNGNPNMRIRSSGTDILQWQNSDGSATYGVINSTGKLGVGTTTPSSTLTVQGSACISVGAGATAACSTTAGTITANVFNTANADLAERYKVTDTSIAAGDIVALDTNNALTVTKASKESIAFGIVSTAPGFLLGSTNLDDAVTRPIALAGRVPVKFSNENGEVKIGDALTISNTSGVAAKANTGEVVIGTALENQNTNGTVTVFVRSGIASSLATTAGNFGTSTQQVIDQSSLGDTFTSLMGGSTGWMANTFSSVNGFFKNIFADKLTANKVETKEVKTDSLCIKDACVSYDQLKTILQNNGGQQTVNTPAPVPSTVIIESVPDTIATSTVTTTRSNITAPTASITASSTTETTSNVTTSSASSTPAQESVQ